MKLNSRQLRQMIMEELESDEWEPQRGPPDLPELPKGTTYNAVSRHIKHGFDQMGNTLADYVGKLRDRGVRLDQDELERVIKMYADELLFSVAMEQLAPGTEPVVDADPVSQGEVPPGGTWLGTPPPDPGWDEQPE